MHSDFFIFVREGLAFIAGIFFVAYTHPLSTEFSVLTGFLLSKNDLKFKIPFSIEISMYFLRKYNHSVIIYNN